MKGLAKRLYFFDYSGRYCKICGFDSFENPWMMDYHHKDPKMKDFNIGHKLKQGSFETLKEEVDKCDLLCSNCHRSHHAKKWKTDYENNYDIIFQRFNDLKDSNGIIEPTRLSLVEKYEKSYIEELISQGMTIKKISEILEEQYAAVAWMLKKFELQTLTHQRRVKSRKESIIRDYVNYGFGMKSMMNKYDATKKEICDLLKSYGVSIRRPRKLFTDEDLKNIEQMLRDKVKLTEIAKMVNCHNCTLYKVIKKHGFEYSLK